MLELKKEQDWPSIRISKTGRHIQVLIENHAIIEYVDNAPVEGGRIGVGVGGDMLALSYFSHFLIQ